MELDYQVQTETKRQAANQPNRTFQRTPRVEVLLSGLKGKKTNLSSGINNKRTQVGVTECGSGYK